MLRILCSGVTTFFGVVLGFLAIGFWGQIGPQKNHQGPKTFRALANVANGVATTPMALQSKGGGGGECFLSREVILHTSYKNPWKETQENFFYTTECSHTYYSFLIYKSQPFITHNTLSDSKSTINSHSSCNSFNLSTFPKTTDAYWFRKTF